MQYFLLTCSNQRKPGSMCKENMNSGLVYTLHCMQCELHYIFKYTMYLLVLNLFLGVYYLIQIIGLQGWEPLLTKKVYNLNPNHREMKWGQLIVKLPRALQYYFLFHCYMFCVVHTCTCRGILHMRHVKCFVVYHYWFPIWISPGFLDSKEYNKGQLASSLRLKSFFFWLEVKQKESIICIPRHSLTYWAEFQRKLFK